MLTLLLGFLYFGPLAALAADAPTQRTMSGLTWMVGKHAGEIEKVLGNNPYISGLILGNQWTELEPERGVYDWKALDAAVGAARRMGRTYKLAGR